MFTWSVSSQTRARSRSTNNKFDRQTPDTIWTQLNSSSSAFLFPPDPSDPISPKDNPTRVPYSPKDRNDKESHNHNDVLEKPGEFTRLCVCVCVQLKSWGNGNRRGEDLWKQFGVFRPPWLFKQLRVDSAKCVCVCLQARERKRSAIHQPVIECCP